jgi:ubiquinone/menaquinone biosynthesis C-methylase UbiE
MEKQFENVGEAFSRQSVRYDSYEENNDILKWIREQVHQHTLPFLNKGDIILEINSGTGIDAVYFARMGYRVHATDLSEKMINQLERKISKFKLRDKITVQKCSYTELNNISTSRVVDRINFDYVFSNFGGLNCIPDLSSVAKNISVLLRPGGKVTLVLMPPVCPWELALIFRGHFKTAVRRLHRNGVLADVEGVHFMTYYFTPNQVLKVFGKDFKKIKLQGLGSVSPPPYMKNYPKRYPGVYKFLTAVDAHLSHFPPFNSWADHFILTMQYLPEK